MGVTSFVARLLFVSVFIVSAYQQFSEFGIDGGPAAQALQPKFHVFSNHIKTHTGFKVPNVEIKYMVIGGIVMKGLGSLLFVLGSSLGTFLLLLQQAVLTPILYDFYNYSVDRNERARLFSEFIQNLSLLGALLSFILMKNIRPQRVHHKKAHKHKNN